MITAYTPTWMKFTPTGQHVGPYGTVSKRSASDTRIRIRFAHAALFFIEQGKYDQRWLSNSPTTLQAVGRRRGDAQHVCLR